MARSTRPARTARTARWWRWPLGALGVAFAAIAYVYLTLPDVRLLATSDPETTAFIELRRDEAHARRQEFHAAPAVAPLQSHSASAQAGRDRRRRQRVLRARRPRLRTDPRVDRRQPRGRRHDARRQHHHAAARQEPVSVAARATPMRKLREVIITRRLESSLTKQRIFETLSELDRVGRRHFRLRGGGPGLLREVSRTTRGQRGRAARGRHHQPARAQPRQAHAPAVAPSADHPAPHGWRWRRAARRGAARCARAARGPAGRSAAGTAAGASARAVRAVLNDQSSRRAPTKRVRQ